jgi:hypothetical protein
LVIKKVTEQQLELLRKQDKQSLLKLYSRLYDQFETDKELEEQEIETLQKIQEAFSLTNEDIKFDERIRPYIYVNAIKKEGNLPSIDLHIEGGGHVILKKEEIVHFANTAVLKMKKSIIIICVFIIVATIGIYGFNYFRLQSQMNDVLKDDPRNNGVEVSVHYGNYVNPSILIYNLKSISKMNSMADVFRVFLQFSEKVQLKKFDVVELSFIGKTKFKINGDYFQTLGKKYSWQNPVYTMRTFPENLINLDGSIAYPEWTGGWLGVVGKQMEDFTDFHKKWYLEDIAKEWTTSYNTAYKVGNSLKKDLRRGLL